MNPFSKITTEPPDPSAESGEPGESREPVESSVTPATNGPPAAKTPVSLLQELYVRKGLTPIYDLVQIEGAVHEPTFKYRVVVGEFMATGTGQSKKKAKHAAAKSVLEKIRAVQVKAGQKSPAAITDRTSPAEALKGALLPASAVSAAQLPDLNASVLLSPYDDGIEGNPVGELQELCMNRRMQPPAYEVSMQEGQPHERKFILACSVGKLEETGSGKSKKLAKRQAAHKMLQRLRAQPVDKDDQFQTLDDDDLAVGIAQRMKDLKLHGDIFFRTPVNKVNSKLVELQNKTLDELKAQPIELLTEIADEYEFTVTFIDIDEKSKDDKFHCLVQMSTVPVAVCYGIGETPTEAQANCAFNGLEYLRIMTGE
ncbi:RISC-loading complex subunit TARBP2-like [Tigriopus californicus]|uniref:RISC-loading complex subunit TARBP2-like n=1 Tax=Tigriopus californicus TaxID=6832 RepID=UPI0027DA0702|nr:RISC-loading complex subunit TARBP2-like [Tigriopus californicus]